MSSREDSGGTGVYSMHTVYTRPTNGEEKERDKLVFSVDDLKHDTDTLCVRIPTYYKLVYKKHIRPYRTKMHMFKRLFCALIEGLGRANVPEALGDWLHSNINAGNIILNLNVNIQEQVVEQKVKIKINVNEIVRKLDEIIRLLEFYIQHTTNPTEVSRYNILKRYVLEVKNSLQHN